MQIHRITARQALNHVGGDPYDYDLNIYRGCAHRCRYCFAIYSQEFLKPQAGETNFFEDIFIKENIVELLERRLASPHWNGAVINIGGVTDSYQPVETREKRMPEILRLMIRYRNPIIREDDIVIAVSQSGETADTLAAVELARKAGAFVFGICNVVGSSIARATDSGAYIHVGPEIGVASTKAFTGQVTVMAMLALAVGREKGTVTHEYYREVAKGLLELPTVLEDVLGLGDRIADLSKIFTYAHNFIYLGRGYNYPTALEGALKLKEISYIHAEGYPAAEMKHGAIALIDNEMPTVAIATPDNTYEKTASNIEEIRARGGKIIAVIARDDTHVRRSADYTIEVPVVTDCLMPIVVSVPLQLLAYYIAVNKGRNVDQPRNLAKSVTVE